MDNFDDDYGRSSHPDDVDPFAIDPRLKTAVESSRGRDQQASVAAPPNQDEPGLGPMGYSEWQRHVEGRSDTAATGSTSRGQGVKAFLDSVTVFGDRDVSDKNKSRAERFADRMVGKVLGAEANNSTGVRPVSSAAEITRAATPQVAEADSEKEPPRRRTLNPSTANAVRDTAGEDVQRIEAFLLDVKERRTAGAKVPEARSRGAVLSAFKGSPINQTRIQVLAAAATARHLEGPDSENARKLNQLVEDNAARVQAIRDEERYRAGIEHDRNGTYPAEIDAEEQARTEQEAVEDKQVFNAAAAVSLGYVAAQGLPSYEQLAELSEAQLGAVPQEQEVEREADSTSQGRSRAGEVLTAAGKGLAQAVGPVIGDDEVAPNLSPVNVAQLNEELASIAAGMAPAMKAAMSGHPRSVKELLNTDRAPDEKSPFFESEQDLNLELGNQKQHEQEREL